MLRMVNPEDIDIVRCVCKNDKFDSLGTMQGRNITTFMFKCLKCGKECVIKVEGEVFDWNQ